MTPQSSGETALATVSDTAVDAIAAGAAYRSLRIVNEGTASGFYSTDGGTTWHRLPPGVITDDGVGNERGVGPGVWGPYGSVSGVKIKRTAGGANLSGVYVSAW